MHRLELCAPFFAAILFYLTSPLISQQVKRVVRSEISDGQLHVPNFDSGTVPYYLTPSVISDYVEYAADAVQVIPSILLPIVGAIYALGNGVPPAASVTFLVSVCVLAFAINAWVMGRSAADYSSRKWHHYSVVTLAGMAINVIGVLMTIFLA